MTGVRIASSHRLKSAPAQLGAGQVDPNAMLGVSGFVRQIPQPIDAKPSPQAAPPSSILTDRLAQKSAAGGTAPLSQILRRFGLSDIGGPAGGRLNMSMMLRSRPEKPVATGESERIAGVEMGDESREAVLEQSGGLAPEIRRIMRMQLSKRPAALAKLLQPERFAGFSLKERVIISGFAQGTMRQLPPDQTPHLLRMLVGILHLQPKGVASLSWATSVEASEKLEPHERDGDIIAPLVSHLPNVTHGQLKSQRGKLLAFIKAAPERCVQMIRSAVNEVLPKLPPALQLLVRSNNSG